jgi:predicted acylesterase/phospholipase RssA
VVQSPWAIDLRGRHGHERPRPTACHSHRATSSLRIRDPLLQGAGALGAYQAGYEALTGAGIHADWIADISIGAINAAIIPLQWVAEGEPRRDTLAFQVDHWNARGEFPRTMFEVMTREKGIRYSSRTRASTDRFKHVQRLRRCWRSARKAPRRAKEQPGGAVPSPRGRLQGLQYRSSHLSRKEPRKPLEGLRIFARGEWRNIGAPVIMCRTNIAVS